ncbi:MAG: hypothetical protein WCA00_13955 [Candidatus Acidiferrales bacterium]
MIPLAILCVAASAVCLLVLAWLVARPLPQESFAQRAETFDGLLTQHAQHFPQLRHSLTGIDRPYVHLRAPQQSEKRWTNDRRQVLEGFLLALGDDFAHLEQLAALLRAMLPKESAPQANIPFSLKLQFRANYRIASLLLRLRSPACTSCITRLTELLGNLSVHTEASMARLAHAPAHDPWARLSKFRPH